MVLGKKIRVLVVDDSLMLRQVIKDIIQATPDMEVIGEASNGRDALELVEKLKPDALTLDMEMPVMDGIQCLKQLMASNPTPVIVVSSITYEGGFKAIQAIESGAFDYIQKPKAQADDALHKVGKDLITKIKAAVNSGYLKKKSFIK